MKRPSWPGMAGAAGALTFALALVLPPTPAEARRAPAPLRILSLDQCADQYAMHMAGPDDRLFLSPRADDPDSFLRDLAGDHPRVRPTLEAALAARPDVVIRYWGGEPRLLASLERRGVAVARIDDAADMDGVRENIRGVAAALQRPERGEAIIADMDARLARAAHAGAQRGGRDRSALYLTPGGYTAGEDTLVGAVFRAAGLANLSPSPFFARMSVERLVLAPPARFVLGFFDAVRADWRGPGRHPAVRRLVRSRPATQLPGALLGCPAWFAAEAAERLAVGQGDIP